MVEIPLVPGEASHWRQRTVLDGQDYTLEFDWQQRLGTWQLTLSTGDEVLANVRLGSGWPLLRRVTDARRPVGDLVLVDTLQKAEDPGFEGLGTRWKLVYLTRAELGL